MDYARYLRSQKWARRRQAFATAHPRVCACGSTDRLECHHRSYERLGAEIDADLMWLCRACHATVHQLVREGQLTLSCERFFDDERAARYLRERTVTDPAIAAARKAEKQAKASLAAARRRPTRRSRVISDVEHARRVRAAMGRLLECRLRCADLEGDLDALDHLRALKAVLEPSLT